MHGKEWYDLWVGVLAVGTTASLACLAYLGRRSKEMKQEREEHGRQARVSGELEAILDAMPLQERRRAIRAYELLSSLPAGPQGEILDRYGGEGRHYDIPDILPHHP